ncbi:myosin light chain kinase, smooth muscle-like [Micropterus dolomieu]|uniref:myosin light chain kinase, smooth muscle-like n=1 Tax=Micropterus dolomieu TaxID=147949 RepID=UPI001E8D91D4|nr:myosin light chain kinase, smooth muscle-like [Micropterus dolomieu]
MSNIRLASSAVSKVTGPSPGGSSLGNEPPAFVLPPRNARVALGGDARLEGKVRGHPEPQVTWYREGRAVIGGERYVVEQSGRGTFSLVVGGVREEDLGRYTCQATNRAGSRQVTVEILRQENSGKKYGLPSSMKTGCPPAENRPSIWSESPPKFITKPSRVFTELGQTGKFSAKTTGRPQPRVTWYKGEAELQSCGRVHMYERSGLHFLEIQEVRAEDAGSYTCSVTNSAGTATATAVLNIQGVPDDSSSSRRDRTHPQSQADGREDGGPQGRRSEVTEARGACEAPRFVRRLADLKVMDGSRVTMTVELTGNPIPEVVWLHDGQEVTESEDFHLLREENRCTLLIQEVFPEDTGTYSCQAWNQYGEDHTQSQLTVEEPQDGVQPWFITKPKAASAFVGQHVLLSCAVAGDPFPEYTWTRAHLSRPLTSGGDYELLQKEDVVSLLIRRVKKHHAGDYLITLRNDVGQCSAVAHLSVTDTDRTLQEEEEEQPGPRR